MSAIELADIDAFIESCHYMRPCTELSLLMPADIDTATLMIIDRAAITFTED